jgi:adenosylmethionine-8-amino-7-oxononanoate aminotransferase
VTNSQAWIERDRARVWHGFTQMGSYAENNPIIVERAEGRELIDVDGRRYLDAISSLWVTTLGHHVPELDEALAAQAAKIAHSTLLGNGNTTAIELAEALGRVVPVDDPRFLFASDGASAIEQAIKIAFQFWWNQGASERTAYLTLGGAYHGDSVGALSLGAGGFGTDLFDPLRFAGVIRSAGYDDPEWLADALDALARHQESLAAVVIEPLVQGAAGMLLATPDDIRQLAAACHAAGVLLICDEVATGFGRTGALFASELCGVRPDIMCIGKGITGGYLPLSATVASGRVADAFVGEDLGPATLYHGHSYSGNALASAVALRHLALFDELEVLGNVTDRTAQLRARLEQDIAPLKSVGAIRQQGLMVGIEMTPPTDGLRWGRRICAASVDRGVLLRPLGDVVVLMPILTSTADEIDRIVDVLVESIDTVCRLEP